MQRADIVSEQSDHKAREHRPRQQGVDKEEDRQDHKEGIDKATNRRTNFIKGGYQRQQGGGETRSQGWNGQGNKQEDKIS